MVVKRKRLTPKERAKLIEEAIRLTYSSLESHLPYVHDPDKVGANFHAEAAGDYSRVIEILTKLY